MSSTTSTSSTTGATTTPASNITSGISGGSVIDVSSLVSQLVAATQAPQEAVIENQTSAVTANISALGTLKSALTTFQSALASLDSPAAFNSVAATSSDQNVLTATAGSTAVSGSYNVTVSNLATAQQLLSAPIAGGSSATIGTGTLSITLAGTSFSVAVNGTNDTLSGIANAINNATGNPGVTATVVSGTDGAHLVLSSTLTGAANTLSVSETDGGTALAALTYGTGNTSHYTQQTPAADASFTVAGVPYTSPSNTVTDALSGVTLNLVGASATSGTGGTTLTPSVLTVANDTSTVQTNIASFVTAYNTLQTALTGLGSYDPTTATAGPMQGNPMLSNTQNQIQQALYSLVGSSNYNSLASIGITTNSDGSLSLNSSTLSTALSSNFNAVSQLFSSATGVATQLNGDITSDLETTGSLGSYAQSLTSQSNALNTQSTNLNTQMTALTASLTQQYSTLNTLLSSLQSTSSYLTQAFASLPSVQDKANA